MSVNSPPVKETESFRWCSGMHKNLESVVSWHLVRLNGDGLWNLKMSLIHRIFSRLFDTNRLLGSPQSSVSHWDRLLVSNAQLELGEIRICERNAEQSLEVFAPVQMLLSLTVVLTPRYHLLYNNSVGWSNRLSYTLNVRFKVIMKTVEETGDFCAGANLSRSDPSTTVRRFTPAKKEFRRLRKKLLFSLV